MSSKGKSKKGEKRKNKEYNVSGESQSKVQVTSSQSVVELIPRMSTNGNVCSPGPMGLYNNQSTPIAGYPIPPNAYMPQGPQSYFAGYISPIQDVIGRFDNLASKLDHVCAKLEKLDSIEKRLTSLEASMVTVNDDMKQVKQQTQDMENSMTLMNDQFEEHKSDLTGLQNTVQTLTMACKADSDEIKADITKLSCLYTTLQDKHLDLQTRSMRDNLVFTGIKEEEEENTEQVLIDFISNELGATASETTFHRVHRMGRRMRGKTRPIVAKFVLHKDRETIRKLAPEKLKEKAYGINEHFPKEINDRRKELYPHYKAAKQQGKKAVLVKDRLHINDVEFNPTSNVPIGQQRTQGIGIGQVGRDQGPNSAYNRNDSVRKIPPVRNPNDRRK